MSRGDDNTVPPPGRIRKPAPRPGSLDSFRAVPDDVAEHLLGLMLRIDQRLGEQEEWREDVELRLAKQEAAGARTEAVATRLESLQTRLEGVTDGLTRAAERDALGADRDARAEARLGALELRLAAAAKAEGQTAGASAGGRAARAWGALAVALASVLSWAYQAWQDSQQPPPERPVPALRP